MNDQLSGGGIPEAPIDDINISNKGQRIGIILVAIIIVAAGAGFFVMYSQKQAQKDNLDALKADFAAEDANGYKQFWKVAKLDLDVMKTNSDLEAKLTEYLSVSAISYAKHIKENAIPVLEKAIPRYRALEARGIMVAEIKAVFRTLDNLLSTWQKFANQVSMYKEYLNNQSKIDDLANQWMGAQGQPKEAKYTPGAAKYLKLMNCILKDKQVADYAAVDLSYRLKDTCAIADEQAKWFQDVAFGCLDDITKDADADIIYQETLKKYAAEEPQNQDTKSVFSIKQCLDLTRRSFETELSNQIAKAWFEYGQAKNALLKAIDERKKEL